MTGRLRRIGALALVSAFGLALQAGLAPGVAAATATPAGGGSGGIPGASTQEIRPALGTPRPAADGTGFAWESTFSGPGLDGLVLASTVWDDGTGPALYVAGTFLTAGEHRASRIARWDGQAWSALTGTSAPSGTGMNGPVSALAVYDGALIAGGSFTRAGGVSVNRIARWDGETWSALAGPDGTGVGGGSSPGVFALEVLDGDLLAGGAFVQAGGVVANNVARWDGSGWSALEGGDTPGVGHSLVPPAVNSLLELDGALIVGGRFTDAGGEPASGIARWDGGWSALGAGVGGTVVPSVAALAVLDGGLVAGGQFPEAGGLAVNHVARWDGSQWSPLAGPGGTGTDRPVASLAVFNGDLIVGGRFLQAGGLAVNGIARWDGVEWSPLAGPSGVGVETLAATVTTLLVADGVLLAGGMFDTAGGVVVNNLARWDGTAWSALPGPRSTGLAGFTPSVQTMTLYGGDIVVAGGFTQAGGVTANRIARWDGETWSPLGPGMDDFQVRDLATFQGDLIAGGTFTMAGGVTVNRIARWDGETWSPMAGPSGAGMDAEVTALAVFDGALVAGGSFTEAGGVEVGNIARWDGSGWSPLGGSVDNGTNESVRSLTVFEGDLIAGGQFTEAGGVTVNRIARWDGGTWSALAGPSGVGLSGQADALVEYDGALIAGGGFAEAGGVTVNRIARWDGSGWSALGTGVNSSVMALTGFEGALIAGGAFTAAGGVGADRIARWDGTKWSTLDGPAGTGADDWVTALMTFDADGSGPGPEQLVAGGHFLLTGGVANWNIGFYGPVDLTVSPDPLDFGEVTVGETAGPSSLTVANTGTADVTVTGVSEPGPPFARAGGTCDPVPFTLAAQESCTVDFTFSPTAEGPAEATIEVSSDTQTSPDAVTLRGAGTPQVPVIDVDPDQIEAVVAQGRIETRPLTIGNLGEGTLAWQVTGGPEAGGPVRPAGGVTVPESAPPPDAVAGFSGAAPSGGPGLSGGPAAPGAAAPGAQPGGGRPAQTGTTITHSSSLEVVDGNTIVCTAPGGTTSENHFLRTFTLTDFGIAAGFRVDEVTFGVESLSAATEITVNLYTLEGELRFENLTLIGTRTEQLPFQTLALVTMPVTGRAPAGATLVVEIAAPDLSGVAAFFPGSNDAGETAPSYVAAPACGAAEPVTYASIGAPGVHLVMTVTGQVDPVGCALPDWVRVDPRSGTVPGGGSQQAEVTLDTTGLEPGEHEAAICLTTNDPAAPLVEVPVALTVTEPQGVVCDETVTGVHPGPLTVTEGTTCLAAGAQVLGEVNVLEGAGLVATAAVIQGPVSAVGAARVDVAFSQVTGPVLVLGATEVVSLFGTQVTGQVNLVNSTTAEAATVAGNVVIGSLSCFGNQPEPTDHGLSNTATGGKFGQCSGL